MKVGGDGVECRARHIFVEEKAGRGIYSCDNMMFTTQERQHFGEGQTGMENETRKFSAPWSVTCWVMTIVVGSIVFVIVPCGILEAIWAGELATDASKTYAFLVGLIPLAFVVSVLFAPIRYTVTDSAVVVDRLGPNVVIPITSIHDITLMHRKEVGLLCLRVFGVGGFCGSYGCFWSMRLGLFKGYVTNSRTLILIKHGSNKQMLLSPERPAEFLDVVMQARPGGRMHAGEI